ncbi:hypothetical protein Cgig2_028885 [Carnegiea gigantea]|uniref:Uncharacterized protein n=1 Tax=Carnegiea gigantea TaxID=171969 RepID=A0A9Q1KQX4_9CARY|nr:hypothetical protein Cgig2_028885 [Carnegiea gigantea]
MTSVFMVKHLVMSNTILRLNLASKADRLLFHGPAISKLSFSSASKLEQSRYPTPDAGAEERAKESERRRMVQADYDDEEAEKVAEKVKYRAKDTARSVGETAKEGARKAGETMHEAKEKAKETAKGAWETAKNATHRIKETVVGEDGDEDKHKSAVDRMEDLDLPKHGDARDAESRYPSEDSLGDDEAKAAHRIREAQQVYEDDDHAEKVVDGIKQKAKDTARSINEKAKEGTHQASDAMHEGKERAKDGANRAGESMHEAKERAKEGAHRAGESMHEAKERTKDSMRWTADKTKEGAGKAAEAMQNVGEKAKETAKGAWETAKDATQKIKEKMVGKDDEDKHARPEDYMEDHLPKRPFDAGSKDRNMHRGGP